MEITDLFRALRAMAVILVLTVPFSYADAQGDPPGRVARVNYFNGAITFAPAGSDEWAYMQLNRPLTSGDRVWVDQGGRSELHIGSTVLRLDSQTSLDFLNLDDNVAQIKVTQGTLLMHLRGLAPGQSYEIDTPNLAFVIQARGDYRINVAADGRTTTVTVRNGRGTAYGDGGSFVMRGQQQVSFAGTDLLQVAASGTPPYDSFDMWARSRDRAEDASVSARYVSREIIGYEQLDDYGSWRETPLYGTVWVPRVTVPGWSPYRIGHWAWVAPWGWTWIDDAPWGFAPYHYGRWAYFDHAWCWVPGPIVVRRPVYAPALVAFVGGSQANVGLTFGSAVSSGVAWFPLGPGELYRPAFAASPAYLSKVNQAVNIRNVTVNTTVNNYSVNKAVYRNLNVANAITAVPASVFVQGQAVAPIARTLKPQQIVPARIASSPSIMPVKQSVLGAAQPATIPPAAVAMQRPVVTSLTSPAPKRPAVARESVVQRFTQQNSAVPGIGANPERQPPARRNMIVSNPKDEHVPRVQAPTVNAPIGTPPVRLGAPVSSIHQEAALPTQPPAAAVNNVRPQHAPPSSAAQQPRPTRDGAKETRSSNPERGPGAASADAARNATAQRPSSAIPKPAVDRRAPVVPHEAGVSGLPGPHSAAPAAASPPIAKPAGPPHDTAVRNEGNRPMPHGEAARRHEAKPELEHPEQPHLKEREGVR